MEPPGSPLDDFILSLTSRPNPRVVFLGTATGDSERYRVNFYDAYLTRKCRPIALPLFGRPERPPADVVDEADVIYVGGGNTANMLAIWRVHGVDRAVRDAWERGAVLAGVSAGAICWFEFGLTDSFGPLAPLPCLGFLGGSMAPHYDVEADRRPALQRMVASGELPAGWGVDNGVALHFAGTKLVSVVASTPGAAAYQVERDEAGGAKETVVRPTLLP